MITGIIDVVRPRARSAVTAVAGLLTVVLAVSGLATLTAQPAAAATLKSITWWENLYLDALDFDNEYYLPRSRSADSWDHYELAYGIDDPTALYRATGKTRYLDQALQRSNNVMATAKKSSTLGPAAFGDSYLGWVSWKNDTSGTEEPLYESYAWRYITRLLLVIKQTPALYNNTTYRNQYNKLLAFAEVNIFDKWYTRGVEDYIYRSNTHMAAHWAYIAMNLSLMTTNATRLAREREVLEAINYSLPNYGGASLHGQFVEHPTIDGAYFWNWDWNDFSRPGSDVSHGNNVVAFIVEARDLGLADWSQLDVEALVVTFNRAVWPAANRYAAWLDGTGTEDVGWYTDGWMKLGRYDVATQQRLEAAFAANLLPTSHGNGALNAKRLGAPVS
ncbi:hypothetical protein [Virgisporangium aurantiacum]|uniref:Uncharacterized protein n=1 Tax=Virgisporangium aurantiacum TaxID=175570 RepID=A0A8J4E1V3_9ACTN|nr:hypothetical protein [Virgisporangium aurantiacum]GIJ59155.1 hypothetical protein Vau01_066710 [Virgisporangium aurantiacum]